MRTHIAAAVAASFALSGCALFVSDERLAESRYEAHDMLAHEAGPLYPGPMVDNTTLEGYEAAIMADDVAFDVWGGGDTRVTGPIDDDLGFHDGIVD